MKNLMKQITKNGRIFWVTYFTFFLILAMPTHAWAYVDPATLTYVVQIIAGVFIAGGVAVGVYWRKIKKLFLRIFRDNSPGKAVCLSHAFHSFVLPQHDIYPSKF